MTLQDDLLTNLPVPPSPWVSTSGRHTNWYSHLPKEAKSWDDGGIGVIQWFHTVTGATYWLVVDGSWKTGGTFHVFFVSDLSNPTLTPVELKWWSRAPQIEEGDSQEWTIVQKLAERSVEERLGIRRVSPRDAE